MAGSLVKFPSTHEITEITRAKPGRCSENDKIRYRMRFPYVATMLLNTVGFMH